MSKKEKKLKPCNCPSAIAQISAGGKKKAIVACREVVMDVHPGGGWKDAVCSICGGRIQLRTKPIVFHELSQYSS